MQKLYEKILQQKKSSKLFASIDERVRYYASRLDPQNTLYRSRLKELILITNKENELNQLKKGTKGLKDRFIGDYAYDFDFLAASDGDDVNNSIRETRLMSDLPEKIDDYAREKIDDYARDWVIFYIHMVNKGRDRKSNEPFHGRYNLNQTFDINILPWVEHQKKNIYKSRKLRGHIHYGLTPYQLDMLLLIDAVIPSPAENTISLWENNYKALVDYAKVKGHCIIENQSTLTRDPETNRFKRVKKEGADDNLEKLRLWSIRMRGLKARGSKELSDDKIAKLNDIGFIWNADLSKVFSDDPKSSKESIRQLKYALDLYCAKHEIHIDDKDYQKQSISRSELILKDIHERAKKDLEEKARRDVVMNLQKQGKKSRELDRQFEIFRDMRRESDLINKRIYRDLMSEIENQSEKMDYRNIEKVLSEASEKLKERLLHDITSKKRSENVIDIVKNEDGDEK